MKQEVALVSAYVVGWLCHGHPKNLIWWDGNTIISHQALRRLCFSNLCKQRPWRYPASGPQDQMLMDIDWWCRHYDCTLRMQLSQPRAKGDGLPDCQGNGLPRRRTQRYHRAAHGTTGPYHRAGLPGPGNPLFESNGGVHGPEGIPDSKAMGGDPWA